MSTLRIVNSDVRGKKIMIIHPDAEVGQSFEARFEQSPDYVGIDVYFASTLEEGKSIARRHGIDLAIFPETIGSFDFVSIQQELQHSHPSIEMIPLISVPTIAQLRESKRIGGVADYGEKSAIGSWDSLNDLIFGWLRDKKRSHSNPTQLFQFAEAIQKALTVARPEWEDIKAASAAALSQIAASFDLSPSEVTAMMGAEMMYMPWLREKDYDSLLAHDPFGIKRLLHSTSSWQYGSKRPGSVEGFLITLCNYISERSHSNLDSRAISEEVLSRPSFLMHPAIRNLNQSALASIVSNIGAKYRRVSQS